MTLLDVHNALYLLIYLPQRKFLIFGYEIFLSGLLLSYHYSIDKNERLDERLDERISRLIIESTFGWALVT